MADSSRAQVLSLADDSGPLVVKRGGLSIRVEFNSSGTADVFTNIPVTMHPAANDDAKAKAVPEIGDEMEDGTILAGYYESKPLYATPRDAPGTYTFNEAAKYASKLDANGHHDFHVPSKGELNVLWENRDKGKLKGTFNVTGSHSAGWCWSSSQSGSNFAWAQRFSDGRQGSSSKDFASSLRCVR
jgi:hypothetical protein